MLLYSRITKVCKTNKVPLVSEIGMRRCSMYAIIETGGKQYKVEEGNVVSIEKIDVEEGNKVIFDKVLVVSTEKGLDVGMPYVKDVSVDAKVLSHGKGNKIIVFKYKAKKNYKRKQGHRQPFTKVQIENINV